MSKYEALWKYLKENGKDEYILSFDDISSICNIPIDHSFLNHKKEAAEFAYEVKKISLKQKQIIFRKIR